MSDNSTVTPAASIPVWYKVTYSFQRFHMTFPPGRYDPPDSVSLQPIYQQIGQILTANSDNYYSLKIGAYVVYSNIGIYTTHSRYIPGHAGAYQFYDSEDALLVRYTISDIVYDPSLITQPGPSDVIKGSLLHVVGSAPDAPGYSDIVSTTHVSYEWFQGSVAVKNDADGDGYDDAGEHDSGPITDFIREASDSLSDISLDDQDKVQAFLDLAEASASSVPKAAETLITKVGEYLPVASELLAVSKYIDTIAQHPDARTAFVAQVDLVLVTAITIGAVLAPPAALGLAVGAVIFTVAAQTHVDTLLTNYWNSTHGAQIGAATSLTAEAASSSQLAGQILAILTDETPKFDAPYYLQAHPEVAAGLLDGSVSSAFAHYLTVGIDKGYSPNASGIVLGPNQVVNRLAHDDPAEGDHLVARTMPLGSYAGDGASAAELDFATLANGQRGAAPALSGSSDLFALANRLAIDLAANDAVAPQYRVGDISLEALAFGSGQSIAAAFPGIDLGKLHLFVLPDGGLYPSAVLAELMTRSDAAAILKSADSHAIGVAEYGGVWVVLVDGNATNAAPSSEAPMTLIRYGTDIGDDLYAGTHTGHLYGLGGDDHLAGGDGNDVLAGGAGTDSLEGGGGDDWLEGGAGYDAINGGGGFDTASYASSTAGVTVSLLTIDPQDTGGGGIDTLIGIEAVAGSSFDDSLTGNDEVNRLDGADGNDILAGRGGDDVLIAGSGNDKLDGGAGADMLYGGAGDDQYVVDQQGDIVFENANEGTDTVISTSNYYLYANIENLTLAGVGNIFGVGNELANIITGNEGGNTLLAGVGDDTVHSGAGVDIIYGEDGADQLFGDADNDVIVGGAGNDTIDGGTGGDLLYGEDGNDTLWGGTDFVFDQLVGGAGNDILHGDSGLGDFDYLIGNTGDDSYYVDTYADLVFENAGEGTDTVYASTAAGSGYYLYANIENLILTGSTFYGVGNELANTMTGSALDNWLLGGAGNDILNGKAGNDVLFGQDGADTFVFEHGTGGDTIADFTPGTDHIDLSAFGFTSFAQVQAAMSETGGSSAITLSNGDLIVLQNVTNTQLHAGDFILSGGSAAQVEPLVGPHEADDVGFIASRGTLIHQLEQPNMHFML